MKKRNLYLTDEQDKILTTWKELTVSEHVRRALDEYIEKKRGIAITSPSKKTYGTTG